jgi:hypothetical protein
MHGFLPSRRLEQKLHLALKALHRAKVEPPGLVTIARSSHDPFTPTQRHAWLERSLIHILEDVYPAE